jgi:hypothetical protein
MADYMKLTPEVCEDLQRPHRTILNLIRDGKIKGKMFSARDWRVDTCELSSDFLAKLNIQKPTETTPETNNAERRSEPIVETQPTTPKQAETPSPKPLSEIAKQIQDTNDNIKLLELTAKETEAQIKLEIIRKERDLPQTLKAREETITQRESSLKQREESAKQREDSVSERERQVKLSEVELTNKSNGLEAHIKLKIAETDAIVANANKYDASKRKQADEYYIEHVNNSLEFDANVKAKQAELDNLNTEITHRANQIISAIKTWTNYAGQHASQAQFKEQYHKASTLWNLKDALQKLMHSIGG